MGPCDRRAVDHDGVAPSQDCLVPGGDRGEARLDVGRLVQRNDSGRDVRHGATITETGTALSMPPE